MAVQNRLFTQDISVIQLFANQPNYTDLTVANLLRDFMGEYDNIDITSKVSSNPGRAIGEISAYPRPYEVSWEITLTGRVDGANVPLMAYTVPVISVGNFGALRSFWLWIWMAPNNKDFFPSYSYIARVLLTSCKQYGSGEEQSQTATFDTQGDLIIAVPSIS